MKEFVVYLLYSKKFDKTYVGFTSYLVERFKSHNELSSKGYTRKFRPWEVMYSEYFNSKKDAMYREKFFKSGKGRERIKEIKRTYLEKGSYSPKANASIESSPRY